PGAARRGDPGAGDRGPLPRAGHRRAAPPRHLRPPGPGRRPARGGDGAPARARRPRGRHRRRAADPPAHPLAALAFREPRPARGVGGDRLRCIARFRARGGWRPAHPAKGCSMLPLPRIRLPSALALAALALPAGAAAGGAPAPAARVLHDAAVVTDSALTRGARATVHVAVTGARSLRDSRPVAGASVELALAAAPAPAPAPAAAGTPPAAAAPRERALAAGTTDRRGHLTLRFTVPPVAPGPYELVVRTRSPHGQGVTRRAVTVEDRALLHLRTDRGVYEPGQTIRWRVTALGGADAHPLAGEEIELTVRDPRGTSIWRGSQKLPRSGMIAGAVP